MRNYPYHAPDTQPTTTRNQSAYHPFSDTGQYQLREGMRLEKRKKEDQRLVIYAGSSLLFFFFGFLLGAFICMLTDMVTSLFILLGLAVISLCMLTYILLRKKQ